MQNSNRHKRCIETQIRLYRCAPLALSNRHKRCIETLALERRRYRRLARTDTSVVLKLEPISSASRRCPSSNRHKRCIETNLPSIPPLLSGNSNRHKRCIETRRRRRNPSDMGGSNRHKRCIETGISARRYLLSHSRTDTSVVLKLVDETGKEIPDWLEPTQALY